MTPAEKFLSLVRHRRTGNGRWLFHVPTREDKHPSGAARELDDGRLLIHDFGGEPVENILSAIGLKMSDLFPEPLAERLPGERRPFPASDILRCLAFESYVVLTAAAEIRKSKTLPPADFARLTVAVGRFQSAIDQMGVRYGQH